ncbi:hypothetical protein FBU59_003366, partial [Linderina macrospora]
MQLGSMRKLKDINQSLKIILSVGGQTFNKPGSSRYRFSDLAASPEGRKTFNSAIATWIKQGLIDGVDIDWEYPTSADHGGRPEDSENFVTWIKELREAVSSGSISISAPANPYYLKGFNVAELSKHVDYIVYLTYDMHGTWDANIKPTSPYLSPHTNITEVTTAIKILERAGVTSDKILMGLGFYGRSYKMADPKCSTTGCKFIDESAPGKCSSSAGFLSYAEIAELKSTASDIRYDQEATVNAMVYGDSNYVSYDDPASLKRKVLKAKELCLAGTAMWAINMDDKDGSLASAVTGVGYQSGRITIDNPVARSNNTDDKDDDDVDVTLGFYHVQKVGDISDTDFVAKIKDILHLRDNKYMPDDFWDTVFDRVNEVITQKNGLAPDRVYQLYILAGSKMMELLLDAAKKDLNDEDMATKWQDRYQSTIRQSVFEKFEVACIDKRDWFTCKENKDGKEIKCPRVQYQD